MRADDELFEAHRQRYAVKYIYDHARLAQLLRDRGLELVEYSYQFRSAQAEQARASCRSRRG